MQLPKDASLALIGLVMYSFHSYQTLNISLVVLNPSGDIHICCSSTSFCKKTVCAHFDYEENDDSVIQQHAHCVCKLSLKADLLAII